MSEPRAWFGQPRGLTILFLTNMWEQFSYYGMRALLVYYMTKQLMMAQGTASIVYGTYTACAYFTPILGGVIADRLLGKRRAIILGGSIMAAGHFMMAFESLFYPALATIAIGNGLFLPSLPSQIDDLYAPGDPRVGWAYNVYYVGVNIGGFLAPLVCGTLGELYGWHWGFGAAGIGMVGGLAIYLWGQRYLREQARRPVVERGAAPQVRFPRETAVLLLAIGLSVTVFRSAYEQVGNTVALWADVGVDRRAGGSVIPMTWFQALNPLLVMVMTPPLLVFWRHRAERGRVARPAHKMAAGALVVGGAYLLLAALEGIGGPSHWAWLVLFFVLLTLGELYILPTGLGLFARLAPAGLGATTVAAWYLATFAGSLTAGLVGTLWSRTGHATFFLMLAGLAVLAAVMLRALDPVEQRLER
ncbi:peptide MFS transporter [Sphingomonas desiccabilis]|uniref:MFS transporter n=1 Tax=Sphingomonas desiccabilis TaxID=429134 RepID=A0A4Q2IMP8_9SPHN|nr:peptide MFS transporter [Sphingomonas desiccabilis]MBB3912386.1 POT family proton-dependent oligopeptide transporter [Sphingomonas desiccabilis]RXZ30519.1 MFS transporter [Sphingomonas desiccabilis]